MDLLAPDNFTQFTIQSVDRLKPGDQCRHYREIIEGMVVRDFRDRYLAIAPGEEGERHRRSQGRDGRILALSRRALQSLTDAQIAVIERSATPVALNVPTIEMAGGSVRCMLAGIHLNAR